MDPIPPTPDIFSTFAIPFLVYCFCVNSARPQDFSGKIEAFMEGLGVESFIIVADNPDDATFVSLAKGPLAFRIGAAEMAKKQALAAFEPISRDEVE